MCRNNQIEVRKLILLVIVIAVLSYIINFHLLQTPKPVKFNTSSKIPDTIRVIVDDYGTRIVQKIHSVELSDHSVNAVYQVVIEFIQSLEKEPMLDILPLVLQHRGIVFSIKPDSRELKNVLITARHIQYLNINLPIEVFFESTSWQPEPCLIELANLWNVYLHPFPQTVIDIVNSRSNPFIWKVVAIALCPFKEVLYMDADNLPLQDVSFLFDEAYKRNVTGIFWPDVSPIPTVGFYGLHDIKKFNMYDLGQESGQIIIIKEKKAILALFVSVFLNIHHFVTYSLMYGPGGGDKDTFMHSWVFTHSPFVFTPPPKLSGVVSDCRSNCQLQRSFDGKLLFWHHNGLKVGGLSEWKKFLRFQFVCFTFDDEHTKLLEINGNCVGLSKVPSAKEISCKDIMPSSSDISPLHQLSLTITMIKEEGHYKCLS